MSPTRSPRPALRRGRQPQVPAGPLGPCWSPRRAREAPCRWGPPALVASPAASPAARTRTPPVSSPNCELSFRAAEAPALVSVARASSLPGLGEGEGCPRRLSQAVVMFSVAGGRGGEDSKMTNSAPSLEHASHVRPENPSLTADRFQTQVAGTEFPPLAEAHAALGSTALRHPHPLPRTPLAAPGLSSRG